MKLLRMTLLATVFAASAATAYAADDITPPGPGYYVGIGGLFDSPEIGQSTLNGAPVTAKFKDGWGAIINGGYKWDDHFRTELEYSHRDNKAKDLNNNGTPLFGSKRDDSVMVNVLYDITTGTRWTPYVGGGIGISWLDFHQIRGAASPVFDGDSSKLTWQAIAGVAYTVAPNWQLLAELRYKGSNNHSYIGSGIGNTITNYDNRERDVVIGVRYSWGAAPVKQEAAAAAPAPAPMATPAPAPAVPEKFLVFFDFDKSNLRKDATKIVAEAAAYAKTNGKATITATGHTDTSGSDAYNMALSERRAQAVQKELERIGVPAGEIVVRWKGESEPLIQTGDGVKEPQNRRVEIILE